MILLYSQTQAQRLGRRAAFSLSFACALLAAALIACISLCTKATTGNAEKMLYKVICLFTLAGWAAILSFHLVYRPSAAEYRHMKRMLCGEEEETEGCLSMTGAVFQIPKGIPVCKVSLSEDGETRTLNLDARLKNQMPPNGTRVRVRTAHQFIIAFEVLP